MVLNQALKWCRSVEVGARMQRSSRMIVKLTNRKLEKEVKVKACQMKIPNRVTACKHDQFSVHFHEELKGQCVVDPCLY